jgi:hypothetical protein
MKPEEIIRGLRYEQKKRENDFVGTCQTNISAMCGDAADCIESLQTQLTAYGNRYPITIDKETQCIVDKKAFDMCMEDNIRLQAQLAESQRREQAAVDDLTHCCDTCSHDILKNNCHAVISNGDCVNWMWRGPQVTAVTDPCINREKRIREGKEKAYEMSISD